MILITLLVACGMSSAPCDARLVTVPPQALTMGEATFLLDLEKQFFWITTPEEAETVALGIESSRTLTPREQLILDTFRAGRVGNSAGDIAKSMARIEKHAALLPNDPVAHALLAEMAFDRNDFRRVATEMIATIRLNTDFANAFSDYELLVVFDRLDRAKEDALSLLLGRRLFDAGWTSGYTGLRSRLARDIADKLIDQGQVTQAAPYLLKIEKPTDLYTILTEKKFVPLHDDVTAWAGVRLEKQWDAYLKGLRSKFSREQTPTNAASLAGALSSAKRFREMSETILPVAMENWRRDRDEAWVPVIVSGATALAEQGQWDAAFKTLDEGEKLIDPTSDNRLNFSANRARLYLSKGDFQQAVALLDPLIAEAKANEAVGNSVMTRLLALRICARYQFGHGDAPQAAEQLSKDWATEEPANITFMWLCLGKQDAARKTWLAAADSDPKKRRDLLSTLQPESEERFESKFDRDIWEEREILKKDPRLRAAVADIGVILSWARDSGVPKD